MGSPRVFLVAFGLVVGWAIAGPFFDFSAWWQFAFHITTTIITFLVVFLIRATQNRDAREIHLKLDELIRSSQARNEFADLEDHSEAELDAVQRDLKRLVVR